MIVKGNCEDERRGLNAKIFIHFNYIANAPMSSSYVVDANELITYLWRKVKWKERNFSPFNQKTLWAAGECFMLLLTSSFTKQTPSAEHEYKRFFPTKYRVDDFITKISFFQTFTELKIFFVSEERSRKWSATHLYCNHCLSSSINATILSDSFFGFLFKSLSLFTMLNICFFSTIYEWVEKKETKFEENFAVWTQR